MESISGESAFFRVFRRRPGGNDAFVKPRLFALVLVSRWLLPIPVIVGCANTDNISTENPQLALHMAGLQNSKYEYDRVVEQNLVYEIASWTSGDGFGPMAMLTYAKPRWGSVTVFTEDSVLPMPEKITQDFANVPQVKVRIGESGQSSNHIGELTYQRFALGPTMQCVFMRQFFGTNDDVDVVVGSNKPPLGDWMLEGWYCNIPEVSPLSQYTIKQFVEGIDIEDWSMTTGSSEFEKGSDAFERGDYATALEEWRPLAEEGDPEAQFNLGNMYALGYGVPMDSAESVKWWQLAAEQDHADAQFNLGNAYMTGYPVEKDYSAAARWFRLAAEKSVVGAQQALGWMYYSGFGVTRDYIEAYVWWWIAAEQGQEQAAVGLNQVQSELTASQMEKSGTTRRGSMGAHPACFTVDSLDDWNRPESVVPHPRRRPCRHRSCDHRVSDARRSTLWMVSAGRRLSA